jgi:bifunctional DNA-binding transcriptional regulator/antitoxin component of YhaV-PrlF toxin-antitoxin module
MKKTSTLSAKGQTTVPREIREYLQLGPRQRIAFFVEEGKVVIRPEGRPMSEIVGSLRSKAKMPTKKQIRKIMSDAAIRRYLKSCR